ncbi:preATP grasp domain-containing protein [Marinitenerispora sediminis]|uniref:ATP-grasp domain-containing protein n=1 Tax=Marinitenerispora sediminis TaxID=1931232 RepID=A0A368SYU3_9ACTN|nr:peptide ligase PGM1-related protein [Marinitenerispora sediminis]RCV48913.1 ATP-grasp domain-containing protein [Marinitenerispora sediminis]RCV49937.1 ATP-grasp domain-containing protein [Marinitenerispora sediminis]RCV51930.1 ATP-grasp domain-containing protein [Marinitenerispora sediminis]
MGTLLVGNPYNEHLVGDLDGFTPASRRAVGNSGLRMAWLAGPGDAVVAAQDVDPGFLRYLLGLKGLPADSVSLLIPPPGRFGTDVLTRDRLLHPEFVEQARRVVAENGIDRVLPFSFDPVVVALARELGLSDATPGFAFLAAAGHDLLNSKSAFRAIAAGLGLPLAEGVVADARQEAEAFAAGLLAEGRAVIVKQDFHAGGYGNEILAPAPGVEQVGASRLTVLRGRAEAARHFERHWHRYAEGGGKVVLEHYLPDSVPLGSEVEVAAEAVTGRHACEMRMAPVFDGIVIPGTATTEEVRRTFMDAVLALCEPVRAMGYRGLINVDGIATPDGRVLLTEFNGRLGGTTHLHWFGTNLVGADYLGSRLLVTRNRWRVPSLAAAIGALEAAGLAFDPGRRRGVVIACDHSRQAGAVEYCAIAEDRRDAEEMEKTLADLFSTG